MWQLERKSGQGNYVTTDAVEENSTVSYEADETSTSRDDRCSMSYSQQAEQLATPVIQGGCIDTTVVNKHDIDRMLCNKQMRMF